MGEIRMVNQIEIQNEIMKNWYVFVKPVNVSGFEWKKTENGKYLKITVPVKQ
jgi:hypothetical protein